MVGTWGGAYGTAVQKTVLEPYASRTGVPTAPVTLTSLGALRAALGTAGPHPVVVDLPAVEAEDACASGLVEPVSADLLARGGETDGIVRDFLMPLGPCGIPATLSAEVVIYDRSQLTTHTPARSSDLFDLAAFPGKRALKREPMGTLELALLADGVATKSIYAVLASPDGVDRAFGKLDRIRSHVVWWEDGDAPIRALARHEVVMAAVYGARAYQAIVGDGQPFAIVWPGALVSSNRWVLLKGAAENEAAREFIKFATDTDRLAELGRTLPYGPVRKSAVAALAPERQAFSPSAPDHLADALPVDAVFWQRNGAALRQRFEAWLADGPGSKPASAP